MPAPTLDTFADATDMLAIYSGGSALAVNQTLIRASVMYAYSDLVNVRDWRYLEGRSRVITSAPITTSSGSTVSYTNSTRIALHSATNWSTLASWVLSGRLLLNGVISEIDSVSSTSATLNVTLNPGQDVTATTDWTLYRNIYSLPSDYLRMYGIHTEANHYGMEINHDEFMRLEREQTTSMSDPWYYAIIPDPDNYAGMALALPYWPSSVTTLDFVYQRRPRQLLITGLAADHTAGTISNTSTAVTGANTNFSAAMIGSVLRFGTTANLPDALFGVNPYIDQRVVTAVSSTTGLTLDSAPSVNYSGVKYRVSDPLDLHPSLLDAFRAACQRHLSILSNSPNVERAEGLYDKALRKAYSSERQTISGGSRRGWDYVTGAAVTAE